MLVVVVSQVISQRKWLWYKDRARPLSNLQKFDSGSRGSLGAMFLIPTVLRDDPITLMAATVLFASFLIGPFVQQASRTVECTFPVPEQHASLPYTHHVSGGWECVTGFESDCMASPSADLISTIMSGVTAPTSLENRVRATCITGNCTFPSGDPIRVQSADITNDEISTHSTAGMCNSCTDIASLVSRQVNNSQTKNESTHYELPNGLNFTMYRSTPDRSNIHLKTGNLTWLGDMLTPKLKSMSRWAYANVTFFSVDQYHTFFDGATGDWGSHIDPTGSVNMTAAVCILYPCLRTYTASVTNDELNEREIESHPMKIDLATSTVSETPSSWSGVNSRYLPTTYRNFYTAVKSPCRVDGQVYDISTNMSMYDKGTKLALYDFTDHGNPDSPPYASQDVVAPEQCIYRQDPRSVLSISWMLGEDVFLGLCRLGHNSGGFDNTACARARGRIYVSTGDSSGGLEKLGFQTTLRTLYNKGNHSFTNVSLWFDNFANIMTNKLRTQYGSAKFSQAELSQEAQGLVWQTTSCVAMHWQWLLYPSALTLVTACLLIWTILANWRHRNNRPVWKESILPLIFYGHSIRSEHSETFPTPSNEDDIAGETRGQPRAEKALLEASEMNKIGEKTMVTFNWLDGRVASSGITVHEERNRVTQRKTPTVTLQDDNSSFQLDELSFSRGSQDLTAQTSLLEAEHGGRAR